MVLPMLGAASRVTFQENTIVLVASPQSEELLREVNSNMRRLIVLMEQSAPVHSVQDSREPPSQ